ncbi:MAG TPA: hypothetical protein VH591_06615 [Ktedonobacterales bacterium]|jgi:hypothetical protein
MNAYEQLEAIREQLEQNGASEDSIDLVDKFIKRAESERNSSTSFSQMMMLRHLLRQREAIDNYAIYNDLQEIIDGLEGRKASDDDVRPAYEDNEHHPRSRQYYKALKEKEKERQNKD